jgi:hypothetical protein
MSLTVLIPDPEPDEATAAEWLQYEEHQHEQADVPWAGSFAHLLIGAPHQGAEPRRLRGARRLCVRHSDGFTLSAPPAPWVTRSAR